MNNDIQKRIDKRISEKEFNIAIGQGINCATEFMKQQRDFLKFEGTTMEDFKKLAKEITDVILELRNEYGQNEQDEQDNAELA